MQLFCYSSAVAFGSKHGRLILPSSFTLSQVLISGGCSYMGEGLRMWFGGRDRTAVAAVRNLKCIGVQHASYQNDSLGLP